MDGSVVADPQSSSIIQAEIFRQQAAACSNQWDFKQAALLFDTALNLLQEDQERSTSWWSCWINIQNDYCYVHHTRSDLQLLTQKIEELKPVIHNHGTRKQRITFLTSVYLAAVQRCRWYKPPEEVFTLCETIGQLALEENDVANLIHSHIYHGFTHLWRQETSPAKILAHMGLTLSAEYNNEEGFIRSYSLLMYAFRMERNVEEAAHWTNLAQKYAEQINNLPLRTLCASMHLWLLIMKNKYKEAALAGVSVIETLLQVRFPFFYIAAMPMLYLAVREGNTDNMYRYAFLLLHPQTQQLPEPLGYFLQRGIECWSEGYHADAWQCFGDAIHYAEKNGYL
jgi:hypothetical protein